MDFNNFHICGNRNECGLQLSYLVIYFMWRKHDDTVMFMTLMSCKGICCMCGEAWSSCWLMMQLTNDQHASVLVFMPTFTFTICCRPSVCLSSVTVVHPTQAVKFSALFLRHLVFWPSADIHGNFLRRLFQGNPSIEGLKRKYSDFGPIEGYISETVQDSR